MIKKILAVIILGILIISWLGKYVWIPISIIVLYFIIRWIADFYWAGKDNDRW